MASFLDDFISSMGPQVTREISKSLGITKKAANQILPQVVPLILGGLKRQKDDQGGAPRVDHILNKYGSADVLGNIAGLFAQKSKDSKADPRLGGLVGNSGVQATEMLSKQLGLDMNSAMKIIPMVAPLVLGYLSKQRDQGGMGSSGIASLLDQDGDGAILDDVAGFLMQSLGGGTQKKSMLGSLLGGLLGGRR